MKNNIQFYVKVIKKYDGCFKINTIYKVAADEEDSMALYDENDNIYCIPKDCLELSNENDSN